MSDALNSEDVRYLLEERWKKLGYQRLLGEERDFLLGWWLEAEASNGTLHQYFSNSTGDSAVDAQAALSRVGAVTAAEILSEAISLFGEEFPTDRAARNDSLDSMSDGGYDALETLTDRLFEESEDVQSLSLSRVAAAYARDGISNSPAEFWTAERIVVSVVLACIGVSVVGMLVLLA